MFVGVFASVCCDCDYHCDCDRAWVGGRGWGWSGVLCLWSLPHVVRFIGGFVLPFLFPPRLHT